MARRGSVPLEIVRPSIISASWRHPFPGWIDSSAAFAGVVLLVGMGHLRALIADPAAKVDLVPVDEDRLAREVAYLAEKWDINEELVRFRSHIELFQQALSADGAEPVGKRLGFLVQEMHREANTIGSKANDSEISHDSVRLKEEVERIREQVENIE